MKVVGLEESLFGIPLSTHRNRGVLLGEFPYELLIAGISVFMFRTTIPATKEEPMAMRWSFAVLLGFLAATNKSYELIVAVEVFSYAVPWCLFWSSSLLRSKAHRLAAVAASGLLSLALSHVVLGGHLLRVLEAVTPQAVLVAVSDSFANLVPTREVAAAYALLDRFVSEPGLLQHQCARLLFVTFHIQCGIGYLGIDFLKEEQHRRNQLIRMDVAKDDEAEDENHPHSNTNGTTSMPTPSKPSSKEDRRLRKSRRFQRSAAPFILYAAVPYMIKIIAYGNINSFAFSCFKDDIHREIRLYGLFEHDNHLVAVAEHSATSPQAYAEYADTIVSTTYDLFNRKLFSLPKVLLLPVIMARQPKMMAQIFPFIFLTDWLKGRAVAYMTSRIEQLQKEAQQISAVRSKVEAFDMKNAELLQRAGSGATSFTQRRWEELTIQVQSKTVTKELMARTKGFFAFIQRNFVFTVLVDCALAHLIAVGKLVAADIFVFSRAIEDAVDMVLMKSRSEAELARMATQIANLEELASVWDNAQERSLVPCNLPPAIPLEEANHQGSSSLLVLRNLVYSRGTASARVDHLELPAGVYALTGANGSGKSTLFRVLMSCETNRRPVDLPPSITLSTPNNEALIVDEDDRERETSCNDANKQEEELAATAESSSSERAAAHPRLSITMPSPSVEEISQTFYWPLYTKPIDWILQEESEDRDLSTLSYHYLETRARRVAEELNTLEFAQSIVAKTIQQAASPTENDNDGVVEGIVQELLTEKEDWFADLSGGQRSKVELVRKVFLQPQCPKVLLVDETMAPLDPRSKSLVMGRLKSFCAESVVIVIYHTDVGRGKDDDTEPGTSVECVPSNDFFDANIHVENKMIHLRPVC